MSLRVQPIDLNRVGWDLTIFEQNNVEAGVLVANAPVIETPVSALTTADATGDGVFNLLMKAVELHLEEEYDAQRITGKEYSMVYMNAIPVVSEVAVKFLANAQQAYKLNAEIGLIRQKLITELAHTDDNLPYGLGFNFAPVDRRTIEAADLCSPDIACVGPQLMPSFSGFSSDGKYPVVKIQFDKDIAPLAATPSLDNPPQLAGLTITGSVSGEFPIMGTMGTAYSEFGDPDPGDREIIVYICATANYSATYPPPLFGETLTITYDGTNSLWRGTDDCPIAAFSEEVALNIVDDAQFNAVAVGNDGYTWTVVLTKYPSSFDLSYADATANAFKGYINGVPTTFPSASFDYVAGSFALTSPDLVRAGDVCTIDWDSTLGRINIAIPGTIADSNMSSATGFAVENNSLQ